MSAGVWRRGAHRLGIDLRRGEAGPALALFAGLLAILGFHYAAKSVRQAAYVDLAGAERLPFVYLAVALLSYPFLRLWDRATGHLAVRRVVVLTSIAVAAGTLLFWWLFRRPTAAVAVVFYVWLSLVFALSLSQMWTWAGQIFDARQARRLFPFLGAGALAGALVGGRMAALATDLGGTRHALLAAAGLALVPLPVAALVGRRGAEEGSAPVTAEIGEARRGLAAIRGSRHLQLICLVVLFAALVGQAVDLQFSWVVEEATVGLDQRTRAFADLYSLIALAALFFQLLVTPRVHRRLGVAPASRLTPLLLTAGAVIVVAAPAVSAVALLWAAVGLKVAENGLRYSLDQASRELLFVPVPAAVRRRAKAFVDVVVQRGAKGLAALLLLPVTFGAVEPLHLGWLALAAAGGWLFVTRDVQGEYLAAFRRGLGRRRVDAEVPVRLGDAATLELLVSSLGSADPRRVLHSMEILADHGRGHLVLPLMVEHEDPRVRRRTLEILAAEGRRDAVARIERRLDDPDPEVRATAMRVLGELAEDDLTERMLPHLHAADPGVRGAAVARLVDGDDPRAAEAAERALEEMLQDGDPRVRAHAARALGEVADPKLQEALVQLLYDRDPAVVREAIAAVRLRRAHGGTNPLYPPILVALLRDRRLKHDARAALVSFGEDALPALVHFLRSPEEEIWVRRALPKTISAIGTPRATAALVEALADADDAFLRRKLVEALAGVPAPDDPAVRARIADECRRECGAHLATLVRLASLGAESVAVATGPCWRPRPGIRLDLLEQLLIERQREHLSNLFGLLAVLYDAESMRAARRALEGDDRRARGHALEYLDNALAPELRREVFAVIDESPPDRRLQVASRLCGERRRSRTEVLRRLVLDGRHGGDDSGHLAAAAVHAIAVGRERPLFGLLEGLAATAGDPLVRETASWACRRLELAPAAAAKEEKRA